MSEYQRHQPITPGSPESFGWVFTVVFTVIGLYPLSLDAPVRGWALIVAGVLALLTMLYPRAFTAVNRWWFRLGLLMGAIIAPIAMGILFFGVIMPIGLVKRLFTKDALCRRFEPEQDSYWIIRDAQDKTMRDQF
jgi:membrane-bound ClpP family serine protease